MSCKVCNTSEKRYKCPKCLLPYCSVNCWKIHKEDPCQEILNDVSKEDNRLKSSSYNYITDSTVPLNKLNLLEKSNGLKDKLQNPHVRKILFAIDKSTKPNDDIQTAMHEPIFVEFVEECLKIVESPNEQ